MDIEQTKGALDWFETKLKTKSGFFIIGVIVAGVPFGFMVWILLSQIEYNKTNIEYKNEQIKTLVNREAEVRKSCAEIMKLYFEMFKEMNEFFSGNLNMMNSIHQESNQVIDQQKLLINNTINDEKN